MQVIGDLSGQALNELLKDGKLRFRVGPYSYKLASNLPSVTDGISTLYSNFPLAESAGFLDYDIGIRHAGLLDRLRNQVDFYFENHRPFAPIPTRQAYAFVEWGMNWCVSVHANEYLKLHAATVAKDGRAIIMPGVPGAGKSTLCAALGLSGWRVLSDEHALIPPGTAEVVPLYRPVSLKNESIPLIRSFASNAVLGPVSEDTHKGTVAHLKADIAADSHDTGPLPAHSMLFPRYSTDEPQRLSPRPRTESFILAAYHSFNYSLLGESGFHAMQYLMDHVQCYDLVYRDLDWAIKAMEQLHKEAPGQ